MLTKVALVVAIVALSYVQIGKIIRIGANLKIRPKIDLLFCFTILYN